MYQQLRAIYSACGYPDASFANAVAAKAVNYKAKEPNIMCYGGYTTAMLKNKMIIDQAEAILKKYHGDIETKDMYNKAKACFDDTGQMQDYVIDQLEAASIIVTNGRETIAKEKANFFKSDSNKWEDLKAYNYRVKKFFRRSIYASGGAWSNGSIITVPFQEGSNYYYEPSGVAINTKALLSPVLYWTYQRKRGVKPRARL